MASKASIEPPVGLDGTTDDERACLFEEGFTKASA